MRKFLFVFALCIISLSSKADLIINNTTSCDVLFQVGVHNGPGCTYVNSSIPTLLTAGNTVRYTSPASISSWVSASPTPTAADEFTWFRIFPGPTTTSCTSNPGNQVSGSCASFGTGPATMNVYDISCGLCSSISFDWAVVGSDIIITIL